MPNLNTSILGAVPVRVPTLHVQRAIAEVLGALDDKIAADLTAERLSDDFIRARYEQAVSSPGAVEVPVFCACDIDFGEAFTGDYFTEPGEGRPLIRIRDLKTFSSQVWTTEQRSRETVVEAGDVVVGMDAEFRATAWLGAPGLLNQRVCRVRGMRFGNAYLREALRAPLAEIENYKTGTTVIHLNKRDLEAATLQIANDSALNQFERELEPILALRVRLAWERRSLRDLRDSLLPQLMSRKIRVKDAESAVGEIV
jgi:type I restriction enzyme S subunit